MPTERTAETREPVNASTAGSAPAAWIDLGFAAAHPIPSFPADLARDDRCQAWLKDGLVSKALPRTHRIECRIANENPIFAQFYR